MPTDVQMGPLLRRLLPLALVGALVLPFAPSRAEAATKAENRAYQLVNKARKDAGRQPLIRGAKLDQIARQHSMRMRKQGRIFHNTNLARQIPGRWKSAGENVGTHTRTVVQLHNLFMASSGHRANIIRARWTHVGIGVVSNSRGRIYETQIFVQR